jgi:predicted KAP-like P-loop ATPase
MNSVISVDEPILSHRQDALGRKGFAEHLGKALINIADGPGIVVGLNGPWGSGKSSLKNMVLEYIGISNAPVEVLEFNPWQYESSDQLTQEFFSELAVATTAHVADEAESRERRAKLWKYGSRVAKVGAVGISAFLPVVGLALEKGMKELINDLGKVMEDTGAGLAESVNKESLTKLKKDLSEELQKLEKPIIVVIDDIDRLDADEIKMLFKLVKANADFPKVSYLLLFARDRVEKALGGTAEDGAKYLEKIVTVAFDVPALTKEEVTRIFENEISRLLSENRIRERLEEDRWRAAAEKCVRPYLDTVRNVKRFSNMLHFLISVFTETEGLNVNFVDLAILEVLREFEPTVYAQIHELENSLTEESYIYFVINGVDDDERTATFKRLVETASSKERQPLVLACLSMLFPQIDWSTGEYAHDAGAEQALRFLRVNRSAYFSRYFAFDVSRGAFSESRLKKILASMQDIASFRYALETLSGQELIQLLTLLKARHDEIDEAFYPNVFKTFYAYAEEGAGRVDLPDDATLHSISADLLVALLKYSGTPSDCIHYVKELADEDGTLVLPVMLVDLENSLRADNRTRPQSFVADPAFDQLKTWSLARIERAASDGTLLNHLALHDLLHYWGRLSSPEYPIKWRNTLAGDPDKVRIFLERLVAPKLRNDDDVYHSVRLMPKAYAEDLRVFQSDLEELEGMDLRPSLRRAVAYGQALNRNLENTESSKNIKNAGADFSEN